MNMKLASLTSFFVACGFILPATVAQAAESKFPQKENIFYIAGSAGIATGDFNEKFLDQTDTVAYNIEESIRQNGYVGNLTLGYSRVFNDLYLLGVEVSGTLYSDNANFQAGANSTAFSDTVKIKNDLGVFIVPGIFLAPSLEAYCKLGISVANISDNLVSPVGYNPTYQTYSNSKSVTGFAAGIGLKKYITDHVSLFAEYNYRDYGKINFSDFGNYTAGYSHSANFKNNSVSLGIAINL